MYYTYLLVLPFIVLSFFAQITVQKSFKKYAKVRLKSGLTGAEAAKRALLAEELDYIAVERIPGNLTDHYSPREKVLRLSDVTYASNSVAAAGVALHEAGHAIQEKENYAPLVLRSSLLIPANIGAQFGPALAIFGLIFFQGPNILLTIGLILYSLAVLFYLVTLPVEINASRRAIKLCVETGAFQEDELPGAKKVLRAAAFTYIAAALTSIATLVRLVILSRQND